MNENNTIDHKDIIPGINTLTFLELETAFNKVVNENNGVVNDGIKNGRIKLEDSLPWFEIEFKGNSSTKKAKDFCQKLADEMNILIYFNRVELTSKEYFIFGVMDFDYQKLEENPNNKQLIIMPPLSDDPEWYEFMDDYGTKILPTHTKINSKKKLKI